MQTYKELKSHIISTDEDPRLRIESFAVINLRGVSTNKTIICFIAMQTYKELINLQSLWQLKNHKTLDYMVKYYFIRFYYIGPLALPNYISLDLTNC